LSFDLDHEPEKLCEHWAGCLTCEGCTTILFINSFCSCSHIAPWDLTVQVTFKPMTFRWPWPILYMNNFENGGKKTPYFTMTKQLDLLICFKRLFLLWFHLLLFFVGKGGNV